VSKHLVNYSKNHELVNDSTLHVIGVIANPVRYQSRYRLFQQWEKEMLATQNVALYTVEAAYGDRHFEVTSSANPNHLQVRTKSEIWLKENLINLGIKNLLPRNWKYVAWVDCDVHFRNPEWALSSIHQLQHYPIIQPWSDVVDLDFYGGIFQHSKSFGSLHAKKMPKAHYRNNPYKHPYGHSGFAWACTRFFYENVEKLLDVCIVGAGDHHMAWGCIGEVEDTFHNKIGDSYKRRCIDWQEKALWASGANVGFTPGRIEHNFHGPKERRKYFERWDILLKHGFCPDNDLTYNSEGLLQLKGKHLMEQDIMRYNRERLEDSIEQY